MTFEWKAQPPVTLEGEGSEVVASMSAAGDYEVTCSVTDGTHVVTADVVVKILACREVFRRGDSTDDGAIDISDAVAILGSLFLGTAMNDCRDAADVNDDGTVDISDPVGLLGHLFQGSARPPDPFVNCGIDPTVDPLGCKMFNNCP